MKPQLAISTVVDSNYQHFIPLFIYCLKENYPKYHIRIFTHDDLAPEVQSALDELPYKFKIIPGVFKDWIKHPYSPISWRFVVPPKYYEAFDYVYVTDIDMMILKEKVSLLNFHLNEMSETGLCYSNSLRNSKHWKGTESLSGLHFASQEWFTKTEASRAKFADLLKLGRVGGKREYDGSMLWLMVKDAGIGMPKKYKLVKRHHGIHCGNFRLYTKSNKLRKRIDPEKCKKWLNLTRQPLYKKISECISRNGMVNEQINKLNDFCRSMV